MGAPWDLLRGPRGIRILYLHRVIDDDTSPGSDWPRAIGHFTRSQFERAVRRLIRRYEPISLDRCVELLSSGEGPGGDRVVLTFDDGYADNLRNACPVLRELKIPATFYVASGPVLDGKALWFDQAYAAFAAASCASINLPWLERKLPRPLRARLALARKVVADLKRLPDSERRERLASLLDFLEYSGQPGARHRMMTPDEVRGIARDPLFAIGGHTCSHPILSTLPDSAARDEIQRCRDELCSVVGEAPRHFAYPNGKEEDILPQHALLVQSAGFSSASTTVEGLNLPGDGLYSLKRTSFPAGRGGRVARLIKRPFRMSGLSRQGLREGPQRTALR